MSQLPAKPPHSRTASTFRTPPEGALQIETDCPDQLRTLLGTNTQEAAFGLMCTAMNALGRAGEDYRDLLAAMAVEIEPRYGIKAMLVVQMTATHTAITEMTRRMVDTSTGYQVRESLERSMTRLSCTHLAQTEALKKHRAKAQQTVRVELECGGQAVVGKVQHGGRHSDGS